MEQRGRESQAPESYFSARVIAWQKQYGRHDLPWQNTRDPYAIWVSEIMLQQTQVAAVIGYYQRFMQRFPTIASLAAATQDDVMQYWSGLGYYSRARNLHAAAKQVVQFHNGVFPTDFDAICALPGIGRSTAAAIASFAFAASHPILDGNVKRVFARHFLIEGWPGLPKVQQQLWNLAESMQPATDMEAYAQGLMDLGATLCTRSWPRCLECPVSTTCGALHTNRTTELPASKPRRTVPEKSLGMLVLMHQGKVLLERRPSSGIWGGLLSLPEMESGSDAAAVTRERFGINETVPLPPLLHLTHAFTHFKLHIAPYPLQVVESAIPLLDQDHLWLPLDEAMAAGIPAPVRKLLLQLAEPAGAGRLI